MTINHLTQAHAQEIADHWHYPGEYAFYDMTANPEDYAEIIDEKARGDRYFEVIARGQLIGFFVVEPSDEPDTLELGLGMAPVLTGRGDGAAFLRTILTYLQSHYAKRWLILDVAAFNVRAQKVYAKAGFQPISTHQQITNGSTYPFITMRGPWPEEEKA